jgi:hypothetical protein
MAQNYDLILFTTQIYNTFVKNGESVYSVYAIYQQIEDCILELICFIVYFD